jgi:prepilin-type processing-associated H-X9-DG protein
MAESESQSPLPVGYRGPGIKRPKRHLSLRSIFLIICCIAIFIPVAMWLVERAERVSPRVQCMSNLHQLGLAIRQYTQQCQGNYPDTLEALIQNTPGMSPAVLICPDSNDIPATGATTQALQAGLQQPGHNSYIYLGKGMNTKTAPPNVVIAYEAHTNHRGGGINVLYGDGHVDSANAIKTAKILAKVAASTRPVTIP